MEGLIVPIGVVTTVATIAMVALCVLSMLTAKGSSYPAVRVYRLGEPWEHRPLLFSAVDDSPVALPSHPSGDVADLIGGSAHGKW